MSDQGRTDEQRAADEPRDGAEETIRDLDVPADQSADVAGGSGKLKWEDVSLKSG